MFITAMAHRIFSGTSRRALLITTQQMPLFPGSGRRDEDGAHGQILNIPLPGESDGAHMRRIYEGEVFPRLRAFKPELILVSAGFDAHEDDPLATLYWRTEDFAWITREVCAIAGEICNGRVVSMLEGGYDLAALAASARAHVEELIKAGQ